MAFVLSNNHTSPAARDTEDDFLSAALHAALQPLTNHSNNSSGPSNQASQSNHTPNHSADLADRDMAREKHEKGHSSLDIVVNQDTLVLRGTGVDVNPALLSGNVALYLSEPTSIKEITLQFRGKARIPPSASESLALNSSPLTYVVCNHEWSFLEGTKTHAHTLKAGRHLFPFQLHVGGSLPSSISTTALGGASVHYKLRATLVRPGFALGLTHRELHAVHPITILRGFSPEALEYQQTLEIENTWPEKLMYSIMIPHKAWAAGDRVTAVVKFQPLVKGASVKTVTTTINEVVKLSVRTGMQENTRAIATARHEIVNGQAVCIEEQHHRYRVPLLHHSSVHTSSNQSPVHTPLGSGPQFLSSHQNPTHSPGEMTPLTTVTTNSSSSSGSGVSAPSATATPANTAIVSSDASSSTSPGPSVPNDVVIPQELVEEPSTDVVTTLQIAVPMHATPGHSLEPIQVSHRIRWSIMITNLDGHVSELRCSLPVHILDHRLYDEAHANTLATRRLLLGARDVDGGGALGTHGDDSGDEEDVELPSYSSHVRDRVANAYMPDAGLMRVTNPWVAQRISPVVRRQAAQPDGSGMYSPAPLEVYPYHHRHGAEEPTVTSQLPQNPTEENQQLHWVNSELLFSLSQQPDTPGSAPQLVRSPVENTPPDSTAHSRTASRPVSRPASRHGSRANSRASSPTRHSADSRSSASRAGSMSSDNTYVHNSSTASRNLHGLFHISMKPFTSLSHGFGLGNRSHSHSHLPQHAIASRSSTDITRTSRPGSGHSTPSSSGMNTPALVHALPRNMTEDQLLLHRAFVETPDYEIASRGFLGGGVPPLSSYVGLPSYDEASTGRAMERSVSDTDLAARMLPRRAANVPRAQVGPEVAATAPPTPPS